MIAALDAVFDDLAEMQRSGAVAATVHQCGHLAGAVAEQNDRFVADTAGERTCAQFVGPGCDIPGIAQQHDGLPQELRRIVADLIASPARFQLQVEDELDRCMADFGAIAGDGWRSMLAVPSLRARPI